jgi:membrane-bound lytic murein transglycosylase D
MSNYFLEAREIMRRKIYFLPIVLLGTVFACSTIKPSTTQKISKEQTTHKTVLSEIDTIISEQIPEEQDNDTLAFLKLTNVDIRYDLNDSINRNFADNLDSLLHVWYINNTESQYSLDSVATDEQLTDSVYINRLKQIPSLIDLSYNTIVKNYIELYSKKRRSQVEYMMGLSEYYFPIFEEILDKEGLPQELKYLPIIESALNPKALSRAGASGLWQFMYGSCVN